MKVSLAVLITRLQNYYGELTPGRMDYLDVDGLAFTINDAIEALRNAQSEAVAVDGEYAWGLLRNTAEAICKKLESESASVTIFDQSALRESLDRVSALTHPAPPLAVTDEMVDGRKLLGAINKLPRRVIEVHDNNGDVFVSLHKLRAALTAALGAKQ